MRTSLTLSASLHLAVLAVAVLNFSGGSRKDAPPPRPVAVEVLSSSDLSRLKAGTPDKPETEAAKTRPAGSEEKAETPPAAPDLKPADKPAGKPAKRQAALPPPKPKPARRSTAPIPAVNYTHGEDNPASQETAQPEPQAKPVVAPLPSNRPEPGPERAWRAAAESRRPPPRRTETARDAQRDQPERKQDAAPDEDRIATLLDQPEPETQRRTRFDPNRIAALLNRDPDAGDEPREELPRKPWRRPSSFEEQASGMTPAPREEERDSYGYSSGQDDRMSANEIDAFIAQVSRCWTPPVGGLGAQNIVVKLHIELQEDGRLARPPQVANSGSSPFFTPAADSAVRAVLQCAPYRMPPEKYSLWRSMLLNFDPRQIYGG